MEASTYLSISLSAIGDRYSDLRIIQPQADRAMERSLRRCGQLTPVVIGRKPDESYEMVDGFKRLRAARKLGYPSLDAKVIPGGRRAMKAAIIHLNIKAHTIAELETGMVIRSLYRQERLSQVEIAALLDRHKSFVCRRLRLVEKLSEEVLEHLKLGLINITIGRELSRLPVGNQPRALATIIKYRFTGAETHRVVSLLLQQPRWDHDVILGYPASILDDRQPDRPRHNEPAGLYDRLIKMEIFVATVSQAELNSCPQSAGSGTSDHYPLCPMLGERKTSVLFIYFISFVEAALPDISYSVFVFEFFQPPVIGCPDGPLYLLLPH